VPTFKLTLEYDGSDYHGWQVQPGLPTIQAALEAVIAQVSQQHANVIGASRTDAGVHALGQVAGFTTTATLSAPEWLRALNGLLPPDIAVRTVEATPDHFHARFHAKSKLYRYRIIMRSHRSALERHRAWQTPYPLDAELMRTASTSLAGRHDFSSFQGSPTDTDNPVCNVARVECLQSLDELAIEIEADRFVKQMVRNIVGTLVEVGRGKLQAGVVTEIIAARDRTKAGPTAPPQGLYLVHVDY
jgi:tRNA pseudouridine38-40 synthase